MIARIFALISPIVFAIIVVILGFITPGYDHLNYTISRLAIEKYGWIQSINFLQLALGIHFTGVRLTEILERQAQEDSIIRIVFRMCSIFLIVAAFIPTDPIENVPLDYTLLTPTGLVHISVVIVFLILSPFGIIKLSQVFRKEKMLTGYATLTTVAGFAALVGSIIWFAFYFMGIFLEYRGIFQKAIALPVLIWFVLITYAAMDKKQVFRP